MNESPYEIIPHTKEEYYPKGDIEYTKYVNKIKKITFIEDSERVFFNEYSKKLEEIYPDVISGNTHSVKYYNEYIINLFKSKKTSFEIGNEIIENIENLSSTINRLNPGINYSKSLFSLYRTLLFYIDIPNINFFNEEEKNILGLNIQKKHQSLTIEFSSDSIIHYSYACNENEEGIFRMTGRAKLTKFLKNSYLITKIINSIR